MTKNSVLATALLFFGLVVLPMPVHGQDARMADNADLKNQVQELKSKVNDLEKKVDQTPNNNEKSLSAVISGLEITGGISAGYFYTSNAGQGTPDNQFLLSNLLIDISQKDKSSPVGFTAALGQTSTPSILGTPENNDDVDIEYGSLTISPLTGLSAEVGLLQPNAGYENSYTFRNGNTFLGALASQQPYNAYGARLAYDVNAFTLLAGYYKNRLDGDEFVTRESVPNEAWELGVSGTLSDTKFSAYHYHLESLRNLTGIAVEHALGAVDLAFNLDYWHWDSSMTRFHGDDAAIGAAVYIVPKFGRYSLPVRLEFIDQGKSGIYLDSTDAKQIYAVTVSPTYHFRDNIYVRADLGYVRAEDGFTDNNGTAKDERVCLAAEIGYTF